MKEHLVSLSLSLRASFIPSRARDREIANPNESPDRFVEQQCCKTRAGERETRNVELLHSVFASFPSVARLHASE